MSPHPNRSRNKTAAANPSPVQIATLRADFKLTQKAAADLIYSSLDAWQDWEQGRRRMHPGLWELAQIKAARIVLLSVDG